MIRYALVCEAGHAFESWFRASDDFDTQSRRGLISCPQCGAIRISKQIMAPAVKLAPASEKPAAVALADPRDAAMRQMLRSVRQFVENNAEHVGDKFAEEARKIHFGETEERAIYGAATPTELRELREEGVEVAPLPILPDERN
jgi:hypothetical protein